jgi:hypothetical protein
MFGKDEIYNYIEKKHLEDGGYFFAEVTPSSGLETYLAVKTLKTLGLQPQKPAAIINFWQNKENDGNLDDLNGLFFAVQSYEELGYPLKRFAKFKKFLVSSYQNLQFYQRKPISSDRRALSFPDASTATIYINILERETKPVFYLITLLTKLGVGFDKKRFIKYVNSLQNDDGGFGKIGGSQPATTFYCLQILNQIKQSFPREEEIERYLRSQFQSANYLEEYYWLVEGLALLNKEIPDKGKLFSFVRACHRDDGGFSRSQFMGISTIEYSYYAVVILKELEKQGVQTFKNQP